MDRTLLQILLVAFVASVPATLVHELGRAVAALALTRGRVCVLLGSGRPLFSVRVGRLLIGATTRWPWGGECLHAPTASRRRSTAILLTGPLAGDLCFLTAGAAAITWRGGPTDHASLQLALFVFALVALVRSSMDLIRASGHRVATAAR
ncbi:MAG TPA: hypothetical protein VK501_04775 [Baekduia sp.]|uniref:hypothetical protein n=1 Tax=Baekduia sp. TaxID=2600305 RepID=UPI002B9AE83F|nr:hypothetical protein [Baekduia sp.]HMJ33210.1 hypothetical protein [Baekduia sp.]